MWEEPGISRPAVVTSFHSSITFVDDVVAETIFTLPPIIELPTASASVSIAS